MIGETLGHYVILSQLGLGGMGEVYLAEDGKLGRKVALKLLPLDAADPERVERFRREARAVAALNHPNIVTMYSVEQEGDLHFLTMEYVEGQTLGDLLPRSGLPLHRLLEIGVPLAGALAAAHAQGIVHRDLKPSNVMVTADGQPKILDFGLAKWQAENDEDEPDPTAVTELRTQEGVVMGTAPYMSPEQLQGADLDHRTDIFSLGVMLFEMTTGRRPFVGGSSAELVSSILRDAPPELDQSRQGLPDRLSSVISLCLEKNPDHRFQSAANLQQELQSLQPGTATIEVERVSVEQAPPSRPIWPIAAGIGLLLAALLGMWALRPGPSVGDRLALAILPFDNLTGDPTQDYLGEGVSAGLLTQLGEASSVRVVGRAATWDQPGGATRIARELGVGSLVEGQVQRDGSELIVGVRLTDVATGLVLWSERYTGVADGLMSLQRQIAQELIEVLAIRLSHKELERMARDPTRSFEAYEFFMRGFEQLESADDARATRDAATFFRQALRLDDQFALAHAGLSEALWRQHVFEPGSELLVEAESAARGALAIDPALPAGQVALARVLRGRGRSSDSIGQLQQALAEHPKPEEAYRELAAAYEQTGDLESAEESLRAAALLGEDWFAENALGMFLARHGRYDEAGRTFERAASMAPPEVTRPRENLATLDLSQGRFDEAVAAFSLIPRPIRQGRLASNIGTAYYYSSHPQKWELAEEHYRLAVELSPRRDLYRGNLADLYLERNREEEARKSYRIAWALVEEQLEANPESSQLLLRRAEYEAKGGECESAVRHAAALVLAPPQTAPKAYQLAKVFALCEQRRAALDALALAKRLGAPIDMIGQDREFRSLAEDAEFREILERP